MDSTEATHAYPDEAVDSLIVTSDNPTTYAVRVHLVDSGMRPPRVTVHAVATRRTGAYLLQGLGGDAALWEVTAYATDKHGEHLPAGDQPGSLFTTNPSSGVEEAIRKVARRLQSDD